VTCLDVDECMNAGGNNCAPEADCFNAAGSFACICRDGFEGDGVTCTDVDECAGGLAGCHSNATCTNTPGTFSCTCHAGYRGDGIDCRDIDECAEATANCAPTANCSNTPGGFACSCKPGFSGNGVTCSDVDECMTGSANCSPDASCNNTAGSFGCACKPGFRGDGVTCTDIDECASAADNCSPDADCTNTPGSFSCACKSGFGGNGVTCTPDAVDECALGTDNCSPSATCTNTTASFTCACNGGYSGNGVQCDDVDECARDLDNCSPNASCANTPGSFRCTCNQGYSGDGVTCTPVVQTCDLNGTFAMLAEIDVEWDAVRVSGFTVVLGGSDTLRSYSLRRQTQTGTTIRTEAQACGDTAQDLCSPVLGIAVTQHIPDAVYDLPGVPRTSSTTTLSKAPVAGDAYAGALEAALLGLELPTPTAAWPATYNDPAITWRDHDGDGQPGVTAIIPTTGRSARCQLNYGALPIPSSGNSAQRVYAGSRALARLAGTIIDCDTIRGDYKGPTTDVPQLNGHVTGCLRTDGNACTPEETASIDQGVSGAQRVVHTRFTMVRVDDNTSCADVRAISFPAASSGGP
jgi:hypothetical protein